MVGARFAREAEIGKNEACSQLGDGFLHAVRERAEASCEVAIHAILVTGCMGMFVQANSHR